MRRLSLTGVLAAVVVGIAFVIALRPALDNDLWWHLSTGSWILDHRALPRSDPFSYVQPQSIHAPTDWLSHVLFAALWPWGGRTTMALLAAGLAAAGTGLVFAATRGAPQVRAGTSILAAMTASYFWAARAQMFTFVLTAVVVLVLQRWREQPQRAVVWWLVPVFAIWSNLHGAVIYGLFVLGAFVIGETINRWIAARQPAGVIGRGAVVERGAITTLTRVLVACTIAAMSNPTGPRILVEPFTKGGASVTYIQEWQPPPLGEPSTWPFFVMLALTVGAMALNWRRLDATEVLLVATAGMLGLRLARVVSLFAEVAAPALARNTSELWARQRATDDRAPRDVMDPIAAALLLAVVGFFVLYASITKIDPATVARREALEYPVDAIAWIKENRPDRELFNSYDWGGYLTWQLPDYPVVIDGRNDRYGDFIDTYAATVSARDGWDATLERLGVGTALVKPGEPLAAALRADPRWTVGYEDPVAVVFVRLASR